MQKKIILALVLLVVVVGIYYAVTNTRPNPAPVTSPTASTGTGQSLPSGSTTSSSTTSTTSTTGTSTTTPKIVTVGIRNFLFSPATTTIKTGTKVTWTNYDSVAHTVTSDSGSLLNSGTISPGQTFSFTFTKAGSTSYHCTIHPGMKGAIIVSN